MNSVLTFVSGQQERQEARRSAQQQSQHAERLASQTNQWDEQAGGLRQAREELGGVDVDAERADVHADTKVRQCRHCTAQVGGNIPVFRIYHYVFVND